MELFFSQNKMGLEGPFDIEALKLKKINRDTPIWSVQKSRWTTAGKIIELQSLFNDAAMSTLPNYIMGHSHSYSKHRHHSRKRSFLRAMITIISFGIISYYKK